MGSVVGRYWAMDRDRRWDRTKRAYDALVHGVGEPRTRAAVEAVDVSYDTGVTDEFIEPAVDRRRRTSTASAPATRVIYWNFRPDRARQLTHGAHATRTSTASTAAPTRRCPR